MGKGFIREIILPLCFLLFLCAPVPSMHSENSESSFFFKAEIEVGVKVLIFDGFKLSLIDRDDKFINEKIPVTIGNYFILFFIKDNYIPEVKVLQAGKEDIELGHINLQKKMNEDKGFLTGVIYKPVRGGKVLFKKGIVKLIEKMEIKIVSDKGESYIIRSKDNGVFCIPLKTGNYNIYVGNNKKEIPVVIEKGKTIIQNIQRGAILID